MKSGEEGGAECEGVLRSPHGEEAAGEGHQFRLRVCGGLSCGLALQVVVGRSAYESELNPLQPI